MAQKRVTFEVAKALKEAGYPQGETKYVYTLRAFIQHIPYRSYDAGELTPRIKTLPSPAIADAPTYLDVWLWLWREKKWFIQLCEVQDKFHYETFYLNYDNWLPSGILSEKRYSDPEEALEVAIENIVRKRFSK